MAGEIVIVCYLLSLPLVAYLSGRHTGDGLGPLSVAWPLMIVLLVCMAPFAALDWITQKANKQYRSRR